MSRRHEARHTGLTLVELVMGMALAVIVMALAIPSLQALMANAQRSSVVTWISASLLYGRSEAIKQASPVSLCPGTPQAGCESGKQPDWSGGWIVFRAPDAAIRYQGEPSLLRTHRFIHSPFTLKAHAGIRQGVTYRASGFAEHAGWLDLCSTDGGENHRILVHAAGRLEVEDLNQCGTGTG